MIYSFPQTEEDKKLLEKNIPSKEDNKDYSNVVVKKPWGYEYLAFDNGYCAIWILHIARKRKTSFHSHPNKHTGLVVLNGTVKVTTFQGEQELGLLDGAEIKKGAFHSTEAHSDSEVYPTSENGAWVMEIEYPSNKGDLVRAEDSYGRAGTSYEGGRDLLQYNDDWLKLKDADGFERIFMGLKFSVGSDGDFGISNEHYLTIEKQQSMKVSDYVIQFLTSKGIDKIFSVCGGGAMHLVDSAKDHYVATHHEQAAAMAAEAYARINGIGACLVTTGPGGTNTITGVAGAWIDSIPVIFISGQVTQNTLIDDSGVRQFGVQESNIVELVKPITKYAVMINNEYDIRYELEKAFDIATSDRPGPVWIDIPLDIQNKLINPEELDFHSLEDYSNTLSSKTLSRQALDVLTSLTIATRPVMIVGNGVRLSGAEKEILKLAGMLQIPIITSWTANDLIGEHFCHIGHCGIFGDRASNFTVQNADFILALGTRLSIPQIGYNYSKFAREAKIAMVDVDMNEMTKHSLHIDMPIQADVKDFINELLNYKTKIKPEWFDQWRFKCLSWKEKYPVCLPEYKDLEEGVNSFYFVDQLSKTLKNDAVIITDMGTSFTCTMQTFKVKLGQRLQTSSGHASMGFGLPGAIGACFANDKKRTICITGEGGLQMNIQELQTVVHNKLPIVIFVINNGGYLTIKHMQQNHFGQYVGSEKSSGISFPNMQKIAHAYGIKYCQIENNNDLNNFLPIVNTLDEPFIFEIMMPDDQPLVPRCSSLKRPDGTIVSKPLEDLYPFLDREEFDKNMLVKQVNEME